MAHSSVSVARSFAIETEWCTMEFHRCCCNWRSTKPDCAMICLDFWINSELDHSPSSRVPLKQLSPAGMSLTLSFKVTNFSHTEVAALPDRHYPTHG